MSDKDYPKPSLTADVVTFSLDDAGHISVLLIQRGKDPFAGRWAIPGGFCEPSETVLESAARELVEETGVRGLPIEEVGVFSRPGRDPRGWVVSVAHVAILPAHRRHEAVGGDDASAAKFFSIRIDPNGHPFLRADGEQAGSLAFDHDEILRRALGHLQTHADRLAPLLFGRTMEKDEACKAIAAALARG
ncbi:NUDIX domain-containing protein [Polyangium spumosum]|uniref:NUDIX domain-containing protein n=1 Tax=Polyangium spumosum TaxID=889282 RepID=A0A6N7PF66_9BACT|nr:NUDIX hydrolase [Polyangium spumosum]MRG90658.1 NUDIX domain-containing protein [Polyangium spumosum]